MGVDFYQCVNCEECCCDACDYGHCAICEGFLCRHCYAITSAVVTPYLLDDTDEQFREDRKTRARVCGDCQDDRPDKDALSQMVDWMIENVPGCPSFNRVRRNATDWRGSEYRKWRATHKREDGGSDSAEGEESSSSSSSDEDEAEAKPVAKKKQGGRTTAKTTRRRSGRRRRGIQSKATPRRFGPVNVPTGTSYRGMPSGILQAQVGHFWTTGGGGCQSLHLLKFKSVPNATEGIHGQCVPLLSQHALFDPLRKKTPESVV